MGSPMSVSDICVWWAKKAWPWLKKHWKLWAATAAAVFFLFFGAKIVDEIKRARKGKVFGGGQPWQEIPNDKEHILVRTLEGWKSAPLPKNVVPREVRAVSVDLGGQRLTVEVKVKPGRYPR